MATHGHRFPANAGNGFARIPIALFLSGLSGAGKFSHYARVKLRGVAHRKVAHLEIL
jgi:hypothetical protein